MKASTKRILTIAFSGLFLIGALVVYGNFIKPTMDVITTKRGEIVAKENLFANQSQAVIQVRDIISKLQTASDFSNKVSFAIPRGPAVTDALNQIYAITKTTQTSLMNFSVAFEPFESSDDQFIVKRVGTLAIKMAVRGDYNGVKGFLESIETNVRVANVKDVSINPYKNAVQGSVVQGLYSLDATVEMYFQE